MAPNELQTGSLCHTTIKRALWPFPTSLRGGVWRGNTRLLIKGDTCKQGEIIQENVFWFVFLVVCFLMEIKNNKESKKAQTEQEGWHRASFQGLKISWRFVSNVLHWWLLLSGTFWSRLSASQHQIPVSPTVLPVSCRAVAGRQASALRQ